MFKIEFTADSKILEVFSEFIEDFRRKVILNGLDESLSESVEELKKELSYIINEKIPSVDATKTSSTLGLPELNMPKSDQELLRHFTGVDIDKIRNTKDYTSGIESNVVVSDNYRIRLRLPIGPYESVEENYARAVKFFNESVMVFKDSHGNMQYYVNPGIDISQHVKIVCSRDNGVTVKSADKFEKYKNSNNMTRQQNSDIGRYAEWSLKQSGVAAIKGSFINITPAIESIKNGDYDEAMHILSGNKNGNKISSFIDKTYDLKNNNDLHPSTALYNDIIKLIRELKIIKKIDEDEVTYSLFTKYSGNDDSNFFEEMDRKLVLWKIDNEQKWLKALMSAAEKVIEDYEGT